MTKAFTYIDWPADLVFYHHDNGVGYYITLEHLSWTPYLDIVSELVSNVRERSHVSLREPAIGQTRHTWGGSPHSRPYGKSQAVPILSGTI